MEGTVSYKLHNNTNWILNGEDTTFTVNIPGLYDIKFTDRARKLHSSTKNIDILNTVEDENNNET